MVMASFMHAGEASGYSAAMALDRASLDEYRTLFSRLDSRAVTPRS